jgi:hypothetical protein
MRSIRNVGEPVAIHIYSHIRNGFIDEIGIDIFSMDCPRRDIEKSLAIGNTSEGNT